MENRTLHSITLISKNNKARGIYFYSPIIKIFDKYFYCHSIKVNKPIKATDINPYELNIIREIKPEYYKANNINPE